MNKSLDIRHNIICLSLPPLVLFACFEYEHGLPKFGLSYGIVLSHESE